MAHYRRSSSVLFIVLLLAGAILPSTLLTHGVQAPYSQTWWNVSWQFRRPVSIISMQNLASYDVLVTLDTASLVTAGELKADGSDIRFTDNSNVQLPYWIESPTMNTNTTRLWVNVTSISSSGTTIWMYYGNSAATAASTGTLTFTLFDDDWASIGATPGPVQTATQPWWESTVSCPEVFEDTSFPGRPRFQMIYDGHNVIGHAKGYAYSSDLNTWTEYDGGSPHPPNPNPILGTGYTGNAACAWGDPIKVGSTYYLYYSRGPGTIYRAESTDLINWINLQPVIDPTATTTFGTGMAILKQGDGITPIIVDGKYWATYFLSFSPGSMYLASSTDLLNWTPWNGNPLLTPGPSDWDSSGLWTESFVMLNNTYYIYYEADGSLGWVTGFAKASAYSGGSLLTPDVATWTKSMNAAITHGPSGSWDDSYCIDPMIREFEGIYYVFYTGNSANGYAYSSTPEGPWVKYSSSGSAVWVKTGTPSVSGGVVTLSSGSSIGSSSTFLYDAVGFRANFGGSAQKLKWAGFIQGSTYDRTMIGTVRTDSNLYLKNYVSNEVTSQLVGVDLSSFHVYEVLWENGKSLSQVDHGAASATLTTQIPANALPMTFYNFEDTTYNLQVDWIFIRPCSDPEPTTNVGSEEQIVYNLTINVVGNGLVNSNNTGPYHSGDVVQLTAVAANYSIFENWSGDLTSSANPVTLIIDNNKTVTANFVQMTNAPWLSGWTYRQGHIISSAPGAGTDYQVSITTYYSEPVPSVQDSRFAHFTKYADNPLASIPNYGASGVVHPDVHYFPNGIDGYEYWMVYTPYPPDSSERPSILRSHDGITWTDAGITNPVISEGPCNPDPDMIYVSALNKWFMVWTIYWSGTAQKICLAYSTDGKTWTEYNGNSINGNSDPIILSGDDAGNQSWENSGGNSKVTEPTIFYEDGVFYLYYCSWVNGNNQGPVGLATFEWDNNNDNILDFQRNSNNPLIDIGGCGHADISKSGSTYYMYVVHGQNLVLLTSQDKLTWTNEGSVLQPGSTGAWDSSYIYRSCPLTGGDDDIIDFGGSTRLYYSAWGNPNIGIATGTDIPPTVPPNSVSLNAHCRPDFGDVRFTRSDGTTLLDYWMENEVDGDHATFWVKIADDLSSADQTIYLYYGKSDATTMSNAKTTSLFNQGDDFNDNSIDSQRWDSFKLQTNNVGFASEAEQRLDLYIGQAATTVGFASHNPINTATNFEMSVLVDVQHTDHVALYLHTNQVMNGSSTSDQDTSDVYDNCYRILLEDGYCYVQRRLIGSGSITTLYSGHWVSNENTLRIRVIGDTVSFLEGANTVASETWQLPTRSDYVVIESWGRNALGTDWADNFWIRKCVSLEPSQGGWGSEESVPALTLQMSPTSKMCRMFNETFPIQLDISDALNVTGCEFEIHYNATILAISGVTWDAWGSGSINVDKVNGIITGVTFGTPLIGNQTIMTLQFNASYQHIWKDETKAAGWKNVQSGLVYIQQINISFSDASKLICVRGGTQNEITLGPDVTYTFSPIQGDINNDGLVNIVDLRTVAAYYNQHNATYDLNGDGIIDVFDLVTVSANFEFHYP